MKKTDDASHAYRGYRRQILFILHKIITEENDFLVFCPEGLEDLSIELDSNIIHIIQVKDYKEPLTLSHIMPKKETSFIRRASHYSRTNPEASIQLVYYNSLGSELNKFLDGNEQSFDSLAGKISNGISLKLKDAKKLLHKINFLRVVENDLIEEIKDVLSSSKLGLSLDVSIDLLCWWIYTISEQRLKITKVDIINKIEDIGAFLRERTLHHEWLGSIVPFSELLSDNIEIAKLKNNYMHGISASINHVNNNLDIIRTDKNREIEKSFKKSNVVIIHGASGQGKTTLGYRYFLDYIPNEFTYQIKEPDNKFHAYDISEAIIKHHKAFNFPICIYYDVQPNDNYWPILIERFYNEKNIKLLLTIREEDWRRSENISEKVDFIDIELNFTKDEAQLIYQKIDQTTFLNFEESWLFFGGDGPLLEYIYLLNWGEKLELRIENQIIRLKKMITANLIQKEVIDVLKIIAVITSYESRVSTNKVKPLMDATNPELILEELNKEYFIKLTASNNIIKGFHPIRSRLMEKHLLSDTFSPWIKVFPLAFPAIIEEDLEVFLLYAFSRRTDNEIDSIIEALNNFSPTSWNTYGGIIKSLLWISIKQYAENNKYIIDDLIERDPDLSFMIALDYDFGNTKPNMGGDLIELVKKKNIKRAELIEECRRKQTSKRRVFKNLKIWLEANRSIPLEPISTNEYLGLSTYMFWLSHFNLDSDLLEGICENIEENFKTFDIDLIARLSFSIYSYKNAKLTSILIQNREFIKEKLINSTGIIHFEDNKDFVKVSYIVTTDYDKQHFLTSEKDNLNDKSVAIIYLLKQLFPEKKYYEINGCGHRSDHVHQVLSINQENDDSKKCIPSENLQHKYYTELSSLFIGYIQYKYRPKDWKTYTENIIEIRKEQLSLFKVLLSTISKYNRNKLINKNDLNNVDDLLYDCYKKINNIPQLPKQAVGEWGFIREDMGNSIEFKSNDSIKENVFYPPLLTYKSYINNCRNFFSYCSFFIRNLDDTISNISSDNSKLNHLSTLNMIDVLEKLSFFQLEFKKHFCGFVDLKNLRKLENEEQIVYSQLYSQCHFLSFYPTKSVTNPREYCYKYISHRFKNDLFKKLKNELNNYTNFKFKISEEVWEEQNSIWIRCEILNFDISDEEFDENTASLLTGGLLSNLLYSLYNTYDKDEITRLLRYHWQSICLFVTYKNKVIIRSVLKQYIITSVFRDNAPFIPHLVEDKHFKEIFNLEVAHSPRIDAAFSLYESFILLKNNLSHIVELFEVIEDKSNNKVELSVKNYLEDMFNSIGDNFQKLLDFQTELLSIYNSIDEPSENFDNAMSLLYDNYKECYPEPDVETDGEFESKIEIGLIREWRKRIEHQVSNYTIIFYLILFN